MSWPWVRTASVPANTSGPALVALSRSVFRGEEEREIGFRAAIRERWPHRNLTEITDSDGLDTSVYQLALDALDQHADIEAVYSIGGGNRAIVDAFDARQRPCRAFIAHDLDRDNRQLLEAGRLSAVLYHDLRRDMHRACQIIMQAHGALDGPIVTAPASIQIITPSTSRRRLRTRVKAPGLRRPPIQAGRGDVAPGRVRQRVPSGGTGRPGQVPVQVGEDRAREVALPVAVDARRAAEPPPHVEEHGRRVLRQFGGEGRHADQQPVPAGSWVHVAV